jgi:DNA-binding protein HU-beta
VNKTELIEAVAEAAGLTKTDSDKAVNELIKIVEATVAGGDKVTIPGFGTFSVSDRKARIGRNPQTGAEIPIAASKAPKFTAGSGFKAAVNPKGKAKPAAKKGK